MVFVELPIFIRCAAELFADEDIAALQNTLLENPAAGDLIPGGRGLRKLRVPLPGRGKRGGDIDLLVETQLLDPAQIAQAHTRFLARVYSHLGEQKVDVLSDYPGCVQHPPIFERARKQGVLL